MNYEQLRTDTCPTAMPAEEYAAGLTGAACPCGQGGPGPAGVTCGASGTCCREGFRQAFQLLCGEELSELLDFDLAAFVTEHYVAGAAVAETVSADGPSDNLVSPLAGTLLRLTPCSRDLLNISGTLYAVPETATGLTAAQVSLCGLIAAVIQLAQPEAEGELTAEEAAARNFRRVRRILSRQICSCACGEQQSGSAGNGLTCRCADGIRSALAAGNLSRRATLAAGPLLLSGVSVLGAVGNVLVLANDATRRIYFVCAEAVEFIG